MVTTLTSLEVVQTTAVWIEDGGRTTCFEHSGHYLRTAIKAAPLTEWQFTPLGSYMLDLNVVPASHCEDCRWRTRRANADVTAPTTATPSLVISPG